MQQKSQGRRLVDKIVQKLHINQEPPSRVTPESTKPCESTTITIPDSPPITTVTIESDEDHQQLPEDPILEGELPQQDPLIKESTRINDNAPNISVEHTLSDDEGIPRTGITPKQPKV